MFGTGNVHGDINRHKQMAMGKTETGAGGVDRYPVKPANQGALTSSELSDSQRSPSISAGGSLKQGAPDHGSPGRDHHIREGKA